MIAKNTAKILDEIKWKNVLLVGVTKTRTVEEIMQAVASGISIIAENRIKEAEEKYIILKDFFKKNKVQFHFIGHLQSNKAKKAVEMFDVIQTVDSLKLAEEIAKRAKEINKIQCVFVEINIGREPQKTGILPEGAIDLITKIKKLENLKLEGLMFIPPYCEEKENSRKYFREMKKVFDKSHLKYLSMGMSSDYHIALEEGSNMIRLGTAIFKRKN